MKTPNEIETDTSGGECASPHRRLRIMIRKNGDALMRTAPIIMEAIEDNDGVLALEELANAESQLRGLREMLEHARKLKIALVRGEDGWTEQETFGETMHRILSAPDDDGAEAPPPLESNVPSQRPSGLTDSASKQANPEGSLH